MSADVDERIRDNFMAFAMKAFAQMYVGKELMAYPYVS